MTSDLIIKLQKRVELIITVVLKLLFIANVDVGRAGNICHMEKCVERISVWELINIYV